MADVSYPERITVTIDGGRGTIDTLKYLSNFRERMVAFGYSNVTLAECENELSKILNGVGEDSFGQKDGEGLTIIGMIMAREVDA